MPWDSQSSPTQCTSSPGDVHLLNNKPPKAGFTAADPHSHKQTHAQLLRVQLLLQQKRPKYITHFRRHKVKRPKYITEKPWAGNSVDGRQKASSLLCVYACKCCQIHFR
jgi:hypothetical protein